MAVLETCRDPLDLSPEQLAILEQGLRPGGVKVWFCIAFAGSEQYGDELGAVSDKDKLVSLGYLRTKSGWISKYETTERGAALLRAQPPGEILPA